ncbi:MAG: ornithine carbamoyltransferase [Pseudohongiellaceae bacterium]|jgi:ornithine carbamoyltransferase
MAIQHFLTLADLPKADLAAIINRAIELKANPSCAQPINAATLALIFEKSSTRTRVAFEVAMTQLGGASIFMTNADSQLGRGEPIADSARVLSKMVDCVAIRTFAHSKLEEFAAYSSVPVINALSDDYHPCQLLADMQTYQENRGSIAGRRVVWVGDGNNMCNSYINAAQAFDFELVVCTPVNYAPRIELLEAMKNRVRTEHNPHQAVIDADLVVTDVWASMGQEEEQRKREKAFAGFQVNSELMSYAKSDALFMHCLPAHRGEEVSAELIDKQDSVVWDEAGNRMHSQKALLEHLLRA